MLLLLLEHNPVSAVETLLAFPLEMGVRLGPLAHIAALGCLAAIFAAYKLGIGPVKLSDRLLKPTYHTFGLHDLNV